MTELLSEERLRLVPLFAALPPAELRQLARAMGLSTRPPGTLLYREGDEGACLTVILEGQVEVVAAAGSSGERVLSVAGPGDFIGEMSLLAADRQRTASVRCRSAVRLLELGRDDFDALLARQPALAMTLVRELVVRFRHSERATITDLRTRNAELARAYEQLKAAQAQLVAQEKLEHELKVARSIQERLLPKALPELPGWRLDAYWEPAHAVSGDFFDFLPLPDGRLGLAVGDVTGHGVPAALLMATTHSVMHAVAEAAPAGGLAPGSLLARANDVLCRDMPPAMFVTCLLGVLQPATGRLVLANAGHPLPCFLAAAGPAELRVRGMPLGLLPGQVYEEREVGLDPGDQLLLFTDGLDEARNQAGEMFGTGRTQHSLTTAAPGARLIDHVLTRLAEFTGPTWEPADDITLLTLQRLPG